MIPIPSPTGPAPESRWLPRMCRLLAWSAALTLFLMAYGYSWTFLS